MKDNHIRGKSMVSSFRILLCAVLCVCLLAGCGGGGPATADLSGADGAQVTLSWPESSKISAKADGNGLTVKTSSGDVSVTLITAGESNTLYEQLSDSDGFTNLTVAGFEGFGQSDMASGSTIQVIDVGSNLWLYLIAESENAAYAAGEGLSVTVASSGMSEFDQHFGGSGNASTASGGDSEGNFVPSDTFG